MPAGKAMPQSEHLLIETRRDQMFPVRLPKIDRDWQVR